MHFYNFIIEKFLLPIGEFVLRINYLKNIKEWQRFDTLSRKELDNIQYSNLEKTLKYTIKNVPFYKNLEYNSDLSPSENLKKFPILTKEVLREERENLVSNLYNVKNLQKNYSSGSSGVQSYSFSTKKNKFLLQSIQYHWYQWNDYHIGDRVLQFGISPNRVFPKNIKDLIFRVTYQNAFYLAKDDFEKIYAKATKSKIEHIIGYPSAINEFSKYLIENNLSIQIKSIISLGDKLYPHFEKNFIKSFNCERIIDTYGCAEGLMMACRNDLPYYYIMSPHVYIEIVDNENNPVEDGQMGYVLVTCFTNMAQPFIRYKLGDLAIKLPDSKYPLERKFEYPLLEKIVGRETDLIKTPNGKTLIVHSFTGILEYFSEIKQFRILQDKIDSIIIEYIIDENFKFSNSILSEIEKKINLITDKSLKIDFKNVKNIPSTPSGKPQIIKSIFKL